MGAAPGADRKQPAEKWRTPPGEIFSYTKQPLTSAHGMLWPLQECAGWHPPLTRRAEQLAQPEVWHPMRTLAFPAVDVARLYLLPYFGGSWRLYTP